MICCVQTRATVTTAGKMDLRISAMKCVSTSKSIIIVPDEETKYLLSRLIGLESSEETTTSTTEENQTESSTEPCIGRCQLEKTNKIEKDPELNSLKSRKSQRCVGLCYILRKKGQKVDPHLEELQKRRPCVGLCYLLKKKMDELDIEDENFQ